MWVCGTPQPLVGAGHGTAEHADRVCDVRASVSGAVQQGTAETLIPLYEVRWSHVTALARKHGVGDKLGKVLTRWCPSSSERFSLGMPSGHQVDIMRSMYAVCVIVTWSLPRSICTPRRSEMSPSSSTSQLFWRLGDEVMIQ